MFGNDLAGYLEVLLATKRDPFCFEDVLPEEPTLSEGDSCAIVMEPSKNQLPVWIPYQCSF